jgi:hypothetical protein
LRIKTVEELAQGYLISATWWDIVPSLSQLIPMCGPQFDYTFQDFLNDASPEEWDEWETKAAELELPLDYYIAEFV